MSLASIIEGSTGRRLRVVNPATLEDVGEVPLADPADVQAAAEKARAAQRDWGRRPLAQRLAVLQRAKDLLVERMDEFARAVHAETGKPRREALMADVLPAVDSLDFCVQAAPDALADESISLRRRFALVDSRLVFQPLGVVAIIAPWNYPLGIPLSEAAPALAAGNAVLLKPSEHTPLVALRMAQLFAQAGLPEGLLQVLPGDGSTGAALCASPVDKIVFTGSVATGRRVLQAAAGRIVPVVLELGGNDPMLVLEDADLPMAVSGALWGRFANAGQTCAAVKRCYVARGVAERFVELLVARARALKVGPDRDYDVDVGPLISEPQRRALEAQIDDARGHGARVATGGRRCELPGYFLEPTVLVDAGRHMRVMREETFGPVLSVQTFGDEREAVALANDSTYGLSASIWSRDVDRARQLAREVEGGSVWVNNAIYTFGVGETPWGGWKESGLGVTHSVAGLRGFCRVKHLNTERLFPAEKPWWFPYAEGPAGYERMRDLVLGFYGGHVGKALRTLVAMRRESAKRRKGM